MVGFYGISTIVGYLMPNPLYTHILNICDLVRLGLWHMNYCMLFNAKSSLYIYIKYIGIIYIFQTMVLIFVAMFITTFRPLYTPAFFRRLECQTYPFISLTGVDCSSSTSHVLWMSVINFLLLISPLKVHHCLHRLLNSHSFG